MPLLEQTRIEEIRASGALPSPTGVAMQVLRLTQNEDASIAELATVIQTDPALSGKLLKFANSAQTGGGFQIASVSQAIVRLGIQTVRQLALGFSVLSNFRNGPCVGFDYDEFWSHCLAMAVSCQSLSRRVSSVPADEAFSCGLLAQIGRLGLASIHPRGYAEILLNILDRTSSHLLEREQLRFAIDHNQLSAAMLQDWGLPDLFVKAVYQFEQLPKKRLAEETEQVQTLCRVLHLGDKLATICIAGEQGNGCVGPELIDEAAGLRIDEEQLAGLYDEVQTEWNRLGRVLDIQTSPTPPLQDLLERAKAQHAAAVTGAAGADSSEAKRLRVLVVDDSLPDLRILSKLLATDTHHVTTALDGEEALKRAMETNPQLIITDWNMPKLNGIELCRALRRAEGARQIYIILVTGHEDSSSIIEGFEAGADDYVVKPVNGQVLKARIRAAQRLIALQETIEQDREEIRRAAADLAVANRKLELMALQDQLTSLPNRRYAIDRLDQEWATSQRSGRDLACLILDIDHFKRINDTYGHDVGDTVLRETATAMRDAVRTNDVVCRYGGEEFLVICPETDLEGAGILADRIRSAVEENVVEAGKFNGNITISAGVAGRRGNVSDVVKMLKAADEALYAAKESGRNRVCVNG
ncbi:MAG: diguanylate cyclase [bacterium]